MERSIVLLCRSVAVPVANLLFATAGTCRLRSVAVAVLVMVNLVVAAAGSANDHAEVRNQEAAPKKEAWRASGRHIAR